MIFALILDPFLFQQEECTNQYESTSQQAMCPVSLEDPIFPPIATPEIKDLGSATRAFKTLVTFHWILIGSRGILLIYTGFFQITRLFGAQFTLNWLFHYICCVCMVSLRLNRSGHPASRVWSLKAQMALSGTSRVFREKIATKGLVTWKFH